MSRINYRKYFVPAILIIPPILFVVIIIATLYPELFSPEKPKKIITVQPMNDGASQNKVDASKTTMTSTPTSVPTQVNTPMAS